MDKSRVSAELLPFDINKERVHSKLYIYFSLAVVVLGLILRAYLVFATPYDVSTHDLGFLSSQSADGIGQGHLGYIEYICNSGALPNFSPVLRWSFYNPPAFHIAAALLLRIFLSFGFSLTLSFELVQYLPCICVFFSVMGLWAVLHTLEIKGTPSCLALAIVSFHPSLTHTALALNNDAMALALTVWAFYFALKWHKSQSLPSILGCALCIGFGMMTKLTVALIAFPIAVLFVYGFFKRKTYLKHLMQFLIFLAVCAPIGLFWSFRNFILYKIPFNFVQKLGEGSAQYIGGHSLWDRFALPEFSDFLRIDSYWSPNSEIGYADHNIWSQTLRSSLFDDGALIFKSGWERTFAVALMLLSIVLCVFAVVMCIIGVLRFKRCEGIIRISVAVAILTNLVNFVFFCYNYPWTCSLHFRYIASLLFFFSLGSCFWWHSSEGRISRIIKPTYALLCGAFCVLSSLLCIRGLAINI